MDVRVEGLNLDSLAALVIQVSDGIGEGRFRVPGRAMPLLERAFDAAAVRIGESVELHRGFADAVSSRTDLALPWERLPLPMRAAAVLYNFAPFADTGASVASKRLRLMGAGFDVISCSSLGRKEIDWSPLRVSRPYIRRLEALPLTPSWASWEPQYRFACRAVDLVERGETTEGPFDFLYSRVMWAPSHIAGAIAKLQRPGRPWVAEFSDPASLDVEGLPRQEAQMAGESGFEQLVAAVESRFGAVDTAEQGIFRMTELLAYALADTIIFTNDHQRRTMLEHIGNPALRGRVEKHSEVANHPTLPRPFYEAGARIELDDDVINFGYFGQFYATRGLSELTHGIRTLPDRLRSKVKLHVFTGFVPAEAGGRRPRSMDRKSYRANVQKTLEALGNSGLQAQVQLHPTLPFIDFLAALDQFDYLVVTDARTGEHHARNPYLPSKYSDYKGSTAHIWSMVEDGSSLDLRPATVKTDLGSVPQVRSFLLQLLEQFSTTGGRVLRWNRDRVVRRGESDD